MEPRGHSAPQEAHHTSSRSKHCRASRLWDAVTTALAPLFDGGEAPFRAERRCLVARLGVPTCAFTPRARPAVCSPLACQAEAREATHIPVGLRNRPIRRPDALVYEASVQPGGRSEADLRPVPLGLPARPRLLDGKVLFKPVAPVVEELDGRSAGSGGVRGSDAAPESSAPVLPSTRSSGHLARRMSSHAALQTFTLPCNRSSSSVGRDPVVAASAWSIAAISETPALPIRLNER
eukprot:scaffold1418_cov114-Isochrysis_galbana.AAC.3